VPTAPASGHGIEFVAVLEADQMGRHDRILWARLPRGGAGFDLTEARSDAFLEAEPRARATVPIACAMKALSRVSNASEGKRRAQSDYRDARPRPIPERQLSV
jgi:hypothetical protein